MPVIFTSASVKLLVASHPRCCAVQYSWQSWRTSQYRHVSGLGRASGGCLLSERQASSRRLVISVAKQSNSIAEGAATLMAP
jgi:hypothetical protein